LTGGKNRDEKEEGKRSPFMEAGNRAERKPSRLGEDRGKLKIHRIWKTRKKNVSEEGESSGKNPSCVRGTLGEKMGVHVERGKSLEGGVGGGVGVWGG